MRPRLSYADVTATIALFLALGGGAAFAVNQLPAKSVGEKALRPGAVTADKIRKNAITSPKIEALAVKSGKLATGAVKEAKLANGSVLTQKLAGEAVTGEKVARDSITGTQINESTLTQVPSAHAADTSAFAEAANPVAFAVVSQEGNVDSSLSKGQITVSQGNEPGIYCVSAAGLAPRGAQVTPRYNGSGNLTAYATIGGTASCAAPAVEVQTHNGGPAKAPFYILLYR